MFWVSQRHQPNMGRVVRDHTESFTAHMLAEIMQPKQYSEALLFSDRVPCFRLFLFLRCERHRQPSRILSFPLQQHRIEAIHRCVSHQPLILQWARRNKKIRVRPYLAQRFECADLRLIPSLRPVSTHCLLFLSIFPIPARSHKNLLKWCLTVRCRLHMLTKKDHRTNKTKQLGRVSRFHKIRKGHRTVVRRSYQAIEHTMTKQLYRPLCRTDTSQASTSAKRL
jgi:hypothetical protein